MKVALPADRGHSVTVLGAISNRGGWLKYRIAESTNKVDVIALIQMIEGQVEDKDETLLVMDNHSAHHSLDVKDHPADCDIPSLFLPVYSSPLNPIEHVWSCFKHHWSGLVNHR